jgi:tRNA1(Val) A37 N6-methylase TrmN6
VSDEADLTRDAFLGGRLHLWQPRKGYRAATDPVLLAASIPAKSGQSVLELGCGAGAAVLCLMARVEGIVAHGLEVQPFYAGLARRNAEENGQALVVHEGDLRELPGELRQASFDHVFANPPFHRPEATGATDAGRDTAHREGEASTGDWIDAGLRRLKPKGTFTMIHRTERLGEILTALEGRAGDIRILPLASREGRESERVIVQARKNSGGKLVLLPSLILHKGERHEADDDDYTTTASDILRYGKGLSFTVPSAPRG